jgi:hypothetical protein
MGSLAEHRKKIKEHLEEIEDAIDIGIEKRPATIGFHVVACVMEMLELYLHKTNLISTGKIIKHSWFKRPKPEQKLLPLIDRKLPVEFEGKEKIYDLIYSLEEHRDALIYGKSKKEEIEFVVEKFFELKKILTKKLEEVGEKIE